MLIRIVWGALSLTVFAFIFFLIWKTNHPASAQVPAVVSSTVDKKNTNPLNLIGREYVLEIMGMGVTLDKFRQGKLWDAISQGDRFSTVREQDPHKYLWTGLDKDGLGGKRIDDALENGFKPSLMYWGVPSFFAGNPDLSKDVSAPEVPLLGELAGANLDFHLAVAAGLLQAERPDRIINEIFAIFDRYPDLPYIVLTAVDGAGSRDMYGPPGAERMMMDGYYIPAMPDSAAVFVLARRERVDPLRPFVWDDPDNNFLHDKLRWMFCNLREDLPQPKRTTPSRTPAEIGADASMTILETGVSRAISATEWLEASAVFARRDDVVNHGAFSNVLHHQDFPVHRPPQGWKPTPWFPIPWTREQMDTFDRLPSLGFLHRPTFVRMSDEHGKPFKSREKRQQALLAGWREALLTLPEAERLNAPARMIVATAGNPEQTIALHHVLREYANEGGPTLDTANATRFIDTDKRLGNTGAATLFVQMAIGVMGSNIDGGISAAVNLREHDEASIVFISPPLPVQGRDNSELFKSHVTPYIDPKNYVNPPFPTR